MKRHINIAVSACFYFASQVVRGAQWPCRVRRTSRMTILYYHAVPDEWAASFDRQMQILARHVRVVAADWQGDPAEHAYNVAITFDDAFESVLKNALPAMAKYKFHTTIFVPSGCLGGRPAWKMETEADRNERVAGPEQLRLLSKELVAIGSHTVTHRRLTTLKSEVLVHELLQSMKDLNALTQGEVTLLALPYGDHDYEVLEACRNSGYKYVFTIQPLSVMPAAGHFVRGRVSVHASDGPLEFFLKAAGAYQWMAFVSAIKRCLLQRPEWLAKMEPESPTT